MAFVEAAGPRLRTVAEILGMSASAVKMANATALGRLRELLGEDFATS